MARRHRRHRWRKRLSSSIDLSLGNSVWAVFDSNALSHRRGGSAVIKSYGPRSTVRNLMVAGVEELPGGILVFTVYSYDPNTGVSVSDATQHWHPSYDQETGLAWCDCPRNYYDFDPLIESLDHWPTILTGHYHCKHLKHLIGVLWRSGRVRPIALLRAIWFEKFYGSPEDTLANYEMGGTSVRSIDG